MATAGVMPSLRPSTSGVVFTARPALRTPNPTPGNGHKHSGHVPPIKDTMSRGNGNNFQTANPQLSVIEVESMLRDKVKSKYKELQKGFQNYDIDGSLSVTKGEFRRVLESYCFPMTTDQFSAMYTKMSKNPNGTVRYLEFLNAFCPGEGGYGAQGGNGAQGNRLQRAYSPKDMNPDFLEKTLREKISKNLKEVLKGLRLYDYNSDGHIQRHELRKVLENYCFKMTDQQFDKLYARFDFHHRGVMNYKDFLMRLGVAGLQRPHEQNTAAGMLKWKDFQQQPNQRSQQGIQKQDGNSMKGLNIDQIEIEFRKLMQANYTNLKRMFLAFDSHKEGFVDLEDLQSILNQFTVPLSDQLFSQLMDRFGIKASGKVSWEFFLDKFQDAQSYGNGQTIPIKPAHKFFPVRGTDERVALKELLTLLNNRVQSGYGSLKKAFLQLDKNRNGNISRKELRKVLRSFQLKVSEAQFQDLMVVLDPQHTNDISYHKFLKLFETRETKDGHKWLNSEHRYNDQPKPAIMAWETIQDIIVEKLEENWVGFSAALVSYDDQTTGKVHHKDLRKVIEKFTIPISDAHFEQMISLVTPEQNGKVNYIDFLIRLGVTVKPGDLEGLSTQIFDGSNEAEAKRLHDQIYRQTTVDQRAQDKTCDMIPEEIITRLKDRMLQHTAVFRKNFNMYDKSGKGKISKKDFRQMLDSQGLFTTDEKFKEVCSRLAFQGNHMTYTDFVASFEDPRIMGPAEQMMKSPNHKCNDIKGDDRLMTAIEVESRLRNKLRENFENLRSAFYKFDDDHNGVLTKSNFRRMLDTFMCHLTDDEFEKLCQRLDIDRSTRLSYLDFLKKFEIRDAPNSHKWLNSDHRFNETHPSPLMSADDVHKTLVAKAHQMYTDLANAFRDIDISGKGHITKSQLRALLKKFILPIAKTEFSKLWARYDTEGKNYVNHADFLQHLIGSEFAPGDQQGTSQKITHNSYATLEQHHRTQQALQEKITYNQANKAITIGAWDVLQQLKDRVRDAHKDLHSAFKKYDTRKKGYLTAIDVQKILVDFNYYLDDDQFYDLLQRIGLSTPRSRLTYEDFCHFFEEGRPEHYKPKSDDIQYPSMKFNHLAPEEAESKLQKKATPIRDILQKAFQAFDKQDTGRITIAELRRVLDNFCFKLTEPQFKQVLNRLVTQDGRVIYSTFMEAFAGVENSGMPNTEMFISELERELTLMTPMPMGAEEIVGFVRDAVTSRFTAISKAFAELDYARIGAISKEDFRSVLDKFVMRLDDQQFEKLWSNLPVNDFGNVEYHSFMRECTEDRGPSRSQSRASSSLSRLRSESRSNSSHSSRGGGRRSVTARGEFRSFTPMVNAEGVESKLKDAVLRNWKELQKQCRTADPQGTGKIHNNIVKNLLDRLQISLSDLEMDQLLVKYDLQNTGQFSYNDFLRHFVLTMKSGEGPSLLSRSKQSKPTIQSPEKRSPMQEAMSRVHNCVMMHWKDMRKDFRDLDAEGNGDVHQDDFRQVLKNYNVNLSEEEFYHVSSKFDSVTGGVNYQDFIKTYLKPS